MATLLKLKGKYYSRIRFTIDGKQKNKLIGLGTAQAAKANRLHKKINDREILFRQGIIELDEIKNISYTNIDILTDHYFDNLHSREINKKTIDIYRLALNDFKEVYQDCDIDTVNLVYIRDFIRSKHANPHTANIKIRTVNAFMNYLYKSNHLKSQPEKLAQFKTPDKSPKYFSNRELVLILNACKLKNKELYYRAFLHLNTGIRLREIDKSELRGNLIEIYDPCKNGKPRTIPVNEITKQYFNWIKINGKHSHYFISRMFTEVLKDLNLYELPDGSTRHFHNLRDTFATVAYYLTRDIFQVAKWMGHSNNGKPAVDTTAIYANFDSELLYQDFGSKTLVIKDIQNALLRNYSLNAVTVAKAKASRVQKFNFEFAYN
ncbi:MAG: tyrosine-type recombinase/integrase [Candidatus Marinimicrobia bacterium]|nr:tyrosine-type recombinase/integrase [Candidatus Neomarinimicrobiota bacterium]MBL7066593.1 tyrosine-type recombinase/integrase [Candidatus Neomarinimicrobiota bacterium]